MELESGHQMPMDPGDVSYLEAEGEDTWVHLAAAERLRMQGPLAEVATIFAPHGFLRIQHLAVRRSLHCTSNAVSSSPGRRSGRPATAGPRIRGWG